MGLDFGLNADAREHLRYGLRELVVVDVAVVRCGYSHCEAIGETRFHQQFAGTIGIERVRCQRFDMAEHRRRDQIGGGQGEAFHHAFGDGGAVDGFGNRLAHADVFEWIFSERLAVFGGNAGRIVPALIEMEEQRAPRHFGSEGEVGVALEAHRVGGGDAVDHVYLVRQQGRNARRIARENTQESLVPGRFRAPIGVVAGEFNPVAALEGREFERAGADGEFGVVEIFRRCLRGFAADDEQ